MHIIDYKYLSVITTKQEDTFMHDLVTIYRKVRKTLKFALKPYLDSVGNLNFYPHPPKMSDLEILSLSITAECLEIDSESLLWAKIKQDYLTCFPNLIHLTRYNARRKRLKQWLEFACDWMSHQIPCSDQVFIVDSIPIPVCKISREKQSTVCRKPGDEFRASKGFSATEKQYYIGYKMHLITSSSGVFQQVRILPAHVHDITFLKTLEQTHLIDCKLIGDRAYRSDPLQLALFEDFEIDLQVPYRKNQRDFKEYPQAWSIQRKRIETVFSQYCDQHKIKRNLAKSFTGLQTRILTKVAAMTFKQYWNFTHNRNIGKTKYALAA